MNETVRIHMIDLPVSIHGFTVMTDIDEYDMYINTRLSAEMQIQTYDHEIEHINNCDFDMMYDINELEAMMDAI